jgi:hypothetical protein
MKVVITCVALVLAATVAGCGDSANGTDSSSQPEPTDVGAKASEKPTLSPTRYGQLFVKGMTPQKAARPICAQYRQVIGSATRPAQAYLRKSARLLLMRTQPTHTVTAMRGPLLRRSRVVSTASH